MSAQVWMSVVVCWGFRKVCRVATGLGKREIVARLASRTGVLSVLQMLPRYPCLIVLNYHRVANPAECPYDRGVIEVTPEQFNEQMAYLKAHFHLADPEEVFALLDKPSQRNHCSVLVTFDDGYLDNYEVVFPILKSHGITGMFFLPTSFIGTERLPWWDRIAYLIRHTSSRQIVLQYPRTAQFDLAKTGMESVIDQVLALYKSPETLDTMRFLTDLEAACEMHVPQKLDKRLFMNWAEAKEMHRGGMYFGSHTHNHELLAKQSPDQQYEELRRSREILERELSAPIDILTYPVGSTTSFSKVTLKALEDTGYQAAFSYYGGVNLPGKTQRFNLLRMGVDPDFSLARFGLRTVLAGLTGKESF